MNIAKKIAKVMKCSVPVLFLDNKKLREENARLKAGNDRVVGMADGSIALTGETSQLFVRWLVDSFKAAGAENFLVITAISHKEGVKYFVTVQQEGKQTPSEKYVAVYQELADLKKKYGEA